METTTNVAGISGLAVTSVVVGVMSALGTFQPEQGRSGATPAPTMSMATHVQLAAQTGQQESFGAQCRTAPQLADTVLFERAGDGSVVALSHAEGLRATAADLGWIRSYCR